MFFGIDLSPFTSAIIAIALNSAAYVATSAFDTAGAATTALNSAKAYANGLMTWAEFE